MRILLANGLALQENDAKSDISLIVNLFALFRLKRRNCAVIKQWLCFVLNLVRTRQMIKQREAAWSVGLRLRETPGCPRLG
jgi:hypothetical protein